MKYKTQPKLILAQSAKNLFFWGVGFVVSFLLVVFGLFFFFITSWLLKQTFMVPPSHCVQS